MPPSPQLRRHMTSPRRLRRSDASPAQRIGSALAAFFVLFWASTLWYSSATLSQHEQAQVQAQLANVPQQQQRQQQQRQQQQSVQSAHAVAAAAATTAGEIADANPYFGWQPTIASTMACSWRQCFQQDHSCTTCRDGTDVGAAPAVPADWIPDVTVLARMRRAGVDAAGNPWPPVLDAELCEPIGPNGGKGDINKECKCIVLYCIVLYCTKMYNQKDYPTSRVCVGRVTRHYDHVV